MKSAVAVTLELDDIQAATEELTADIRSKLELSKNSVGILYYDYEMDGAALSLSLQKELCIDIVGSTALAALDGVQGYVDMSAVLTVLTADDCDFGTAISEPLTADNVEEGTRSVYYNAKKQLRDEPKLIYALTPSSSDVMVDLYVDYLDEVSGSVPVIGGVPSSTLRTERTVLYNGKTYSDRLAVILIGGNIRPLFTIKNVITTFSEKKCMITRSEGSYIYEIDNGVPFLDYMKRFGLGTTDLMNDLESVFFQTHPMLIENGDNTEETPYVRILIDFDPKNGSACSFARMPQGATLTVALLRPDDIGESARNGILEILNKIEANKTDDYEYTTVFCITCGARHLVLTPHHDLEGKIIREAVPKQLNLSGFYSYGEIAPTFYKNGRATNCTHNASITFCAF